MTPAPRTCLNRNLRPLFLCLLLAACGDNYATEGESAFARGDFTVAERMLAVAARSNDSAPPATRFMWGASLAKLNRIDEATKVLLPLMSDQEFGPRATLLCVEAAINQGRLEDVRRMVSEAADRWPQHPGSAMAAFRLAEADYFSARSELEAALARYGGVPALTKQEARISRLMFAKEIGAAEQPLLQAMASDCALSETTSLLPLLEAARKAAARFEESAMATGAVDPAAFEAILRLVEIAKHRAAPDAVLLQAQRILQLKPAAVAAIERRGALERARDDAANHLTQAFESAGRVSDAIAALEAALEHFANPLALDEKFARLYYISGDVEKLDVIAQRWMKAEGRNLLASFYRGYVLFRLGRHDEAQVYLERARGMNITTQAFNLMSALNFAKQGNHARAAPLFAMAAENGPMDADSSIAWANSLMALGDAPRARTLMREGMKVRFPNPTSEGHQKLLQNLLTYYKEAGHAIDTLEEARTLHNEDSTNSFVTLRLAQLELAAGETRMALQLCREVQADNPTLADAWSLGAEVALALHDAASAAPMLDRLNRLRPNDAAVAWLQARTALAQKNTARARHYATQALERDPNTLGPALVLVQAALAEKHPREALEIGETVVKRAGESAGLLALLGSAAQQLRQNDKALDYLERAEKAGATDSETSLLLSRALVRSGRKEEGIARGQKLLDGPSTTPELQLSVAEIMLEAGATKEAASLAEQALKLIARGPDFVGALQVIARCQLAAENWLQACTTLLALRRASGATEAVTLFIPAAMKHAAVAEAGRCAELAVTEKTLIGEAAGAALSALVTTKSWAAAKQAAALCAMKNPEYQLVDLPLRARVLAHDGKPDQALKLLLTAIETGTASVKRDAIETLAEHSIAKDGDAAIAAQLVQWLRDAPNSVMLGELGAAAALRANNPDEAAALLAAAAKHAKGREDIARLQARVELVRQRPREAAKFVASGTEPKTRALAALCEALASATPKPATAGAACALLLQRMWAEAAVAAAVAEDLPPTWRAELAQLAQRLQAHPAEAVIFARCFTTALALMNEPLLQEQCTTAWDDAGKAVVSEGKSLTVWRALTRLATGDGAAAARLAATLIEAPNPSHFVLAFAARAALANAGAVNMLKVLEGAGLNAALPAPLARELAELARNAGDHASAAAILQRIAAPEDVDLAVLSMCLAVSAPNRAGSVALRIKSETNLPRSALFLRATALARSGAISEGFALVQRTMANGGPLDSAELLLALESAAAAEDDILTELLLQQALAAQPLSVRVMSRAAAVLRQYKRLPNAQNELNDAMTFMDPGGVLRSTLR